MVSKMDWVVLALIGIGCVATLAIYRFAFGRGDGARNLLASVALSCTAWWPLLFAQKEICWAIWQGRGMAFGYGGDKTLSNLVVELPLVAILAGVAGSVGRWLLGTRYSKRIALSVALGAAILVVVAIPALPE